MLEQVSQFARLSRLEASVPHGGKAYSVIACFEIEAPALIQPELEIQISAPGGEFLSVRSGQFGHLPAWLPRGQIAWRLALPEWIWREPSVQFRLRLSDRFRGARRIGLEHTFSRSVEPGEVSAHPAQAHLALMELEAGIQLAQQPWQGQYENWFFRHFAHAAEVVGSYLLGDSDQLGGRVLDVGCGDGITDYGLMLRYQPELLIGVDPFEGYRRLPEILAESGLPRELPSGLRFEAHSANALPYDDDAFDVVISWGSLEHIVGGYTQALNEIRRVLKPGGLLFVHPGLFYSNIGHHLGEFCDEPFFHLRWPEGKLKAHVLGRQANYMDRAGEFASSAQYWQWYRELNRITVAGFEQELRYLGFEFLRAALRVADRIDYTPELQKYSLIDLSASELYLSCINRKR
jgi:ubiquinone/menaquinone biosynthesis C-methylase UbiE